jgi:hypothetical protein
MRRIQWGILRTYQDDSKVQAFFLLKMFLSKKYRGTEKSACQGERRTAFKTMIGKHQTEENIGILVVDERKVLRKPKRTDFEDIKCIQLLFFFVKIGV